MRVEISGTPYHLQQPNAQAPAATPTQQQKLFDFFGIKLPGRNNQEEDPLGALGGILGALFGKKPATNPNAGLQPQAQDIQRLTSMLSAPPGTVGGNVGANWGGLNIPRE